MIQPVKIVAIKRSLSGSAWHRLTLPLSKLGADFATQPTEDLFRMYDSVWIHYKTIVHPTQLAMWRAQYGTQIVLDIDDTWNIPLNHPAYDAVSENAKWSKKFAVVADWVVCSTPEVEEMVKPYNENTIVVPNRIPYGEGQYQVWHESKESFMNRKIRIGYCGSISHLEDWESISGKLKRVIQDTEVIQKCEFVVCGVPDFNKLSEPPWIEDQVEYLVKTKYKDTPENREKIKSILYKGHVDYNRDLWKRVTKSLGNPLIIGDRPVENYIDLYREIDILLCPLVDNDLNSKKSSLKILESACTDTLCILGNLYKGKGQECDHHLYEDWYSNIKTLIKNKEKLYEIKLDISQKVRNLYDYTNDCVLPRQEILGKKKELDLDIYGITYKDGQVTEYKEYRNKVNTIEDKSYFFETNVIKKLYG